MNLTLSKQGKKMGFKEFAQVFGKHFRSFPQPLRQKAMQEKYTQLTGKSAKSGNVKKINSKSKTV
jgi:hypothetical protein